MSLSWTLLMKDDRGQNLQNHSKFSHIFPSLLSLCQSTGHALTWCICICKKHWLAFCTWGCPKQNKSIPVWYTQSSRVWAQLKTCLKHKSSYHFSFTAGQRQMKSEWEETFLQSYGNNQAQLFIFQKVIVFFCWSLDNLVKQTFCLLCWIKYKGFYFQNEELQRSHLCMKEWFWNFCCKVWFIV